MAEAISYKSKARNRAALLTLLLMGTLVTILLLIILYTPIPPYPEGGGGKGDGIELNLGFSDVGMGNNPQELSMPEKETPVTQPTPEKEEIMKQDMEDAPSIDEKVIERKKPKKEVKKPIVETTKKPVKTEPEKPKQVVNKNALYSSKTNQTSADGDNNVAGDKGNPNGNLGAKAFGNKGGSGGSGGGTGGGIGSGTGSGVGVGIISNINNRTPLSLPLPKYTQQSEGDVVVELTLDSQGKVIKAEPGQKGTTTTDNSLWEEARLAAKQASFDIKPGATPQRVTIRYRFRLQ
jgi:TonB family protein